MSYPGILKKRTTSRGSIKKQLKKESGSFFFISSEKFKHDRCKMKKTTSRPRPGLMHKCSSRYLANRVGLRIAGLDGAATTLYLPTVAFSRYLICIRLFEFACAYLLCDNLATGGTKILRDHLPPPFFFLLFLEKAVEWVGEMSGRVHW